MDIILTAGDLSRLKPSTRTDIVNLILGAAGSSAPTPQGTSDGWDWDEVVNLSPDRVSEFMQGCSEETIAGLRVIAEHGPIISADLLKQVGIDNYGHFQGRVTKRTRTVTGDKHSFLLSWDDWRSTENAARGFGHYGVTEITFQSLRGYFGL